jgi:dipeptidyl aminopeptidase/acylaminoacyl peptidase
MQRIVDRRAFFARCLLLAACCVLLPLASSAEGDSPTIPGGVDFKQVLSLASVGSPSVSPDGSAVVYTVRSTDWENNRYDTEIWMARRGSEPFQLTRSKETSSTNPSWSPDSKAIAFMSSRGDGRQIQWMRHDGGEPIQLTAVEEGIDDFEWSHGGASLAVVITDPPRPDAEKEQKAYGDFAVEDADSQMSHIWVLDVGAALEGGGDIALPAEKDDDESAGEEDETDSADEEEEPSPWRRLTGGDEFTVGSIAWSPDDSAIAFAHSADTRIESFEHTDISIVDVANGEVRPLVALEGYESGPRWSPDGQWILFHTADGANPYYGNTELAKVPAAGGEVEVLTADFDEDIQAIAWLDEGILFRALDKTYRKLYLWTDTGPREVVDQAPRGVFGVDVSPDGSVIAFTGADPDSLTEVFRAEGPDFRAERLTDMTAATSGWQTGTREVIEWQSRDGATIEGVLIKPDNFDPSVKHPLMVIIHGGPTGISTPSLVYGYVYPVQQWLAKGAVVMMPNYRGSAGYGGAFRELNVRNLGVGDAWDVLSGVDHLVDQGFIDEKRMGSMGWSQGGYISAFLTTSSDRFAAISVGAGISNWMTYYVNTDIHPFTRHYLKGTPWSDPEVYAKTSPMPHINKASTPTLIQHGEFDRRVPTPNAYELYQGLQDVGVDTELVIYKGFGHGITKPKERLAAVWHNWQWFARYLWDEEVDLPIE